MEIGVAVVAGLVIAEHLVCFRLATAGKTNLDCNPLGVVCCDDIAPGHHEIDDALTLGLLAYLLALLGLGREGVVCR